MADLKVLGVMVNVYAILVLIFVWDLITAEASICREKQFLNVRLQQCLNCTVCQTGYIVLRPCELHRDTHCGPISEISDLLEDNFQRRHRHEKYREETAKQPNIEWRYGDDVPSELSPAIEIPEAMEVSSAEAPFTRAESLVWDWQAIALTSAVFACLTFFVVIALYSFIQARQWRRLKENFDNDVEELSARLGLMAAISTEKCEFLDNTQPVLVSCPASMESNYLSNKCLYLEQLINDRIDDKKNNTLPKGNVYIEENKKPKK